MRFRLNMLRHGHFVTSLVLAIFSVQLFAADLPPVTEDDFGLKIVHFNVGQADAALVLHRQEHSSEGHCASIESGLPNH